MLEAPHHQVHVLIQLPRDGGDVLALQLVELLARAVTDPEHRGAPTKHAQHRLYVELIYKTGLSTKS